MTKKSSAESSMYAALGASSAKEGVLNAIGEGKTSRYFASPSPDPAGDPGYAYFLHADGAGTKSIVAYLLYRETGDVSWFRSLAIDSLVMNLDDLACAGAIDGLVLSNTIGRNRRLVPDEAVAEIISGYHEMVAKLHKVGIAISMAGGETADVGDLVRTAIVDSTLSARIPRSKLVDAYRVSDGDVIVGFSSTGQSILEEMPNSGIGSNGLTLARNAVLSRFHADTYPEVVDPLAPAHLSYSGSYKITDQHKELGTSVGAALLSPTKTYAPLIKAMLERFFDSVHSLVHCTGGGQTKIKRFGQKVRFIKDNLFPTPTIFALIQEQARVPWEEMYAVFNMGHRLEACVTPEVAPDLITLAAQFGIAAQVVGRVTSTEGDNEVVIRSSNGEFTY